MYWRIYERGMEFGWAFIIIFTILIILGIIHLVSLISEGRRKEPHGESPLYILKKRYAKGEITHDEFIAMKDEMSTEFCKQKR